MKLTLITLTALSLATTAYADPAEDAATLMQCTASSDDALACIGVVATPCLEGADTVAAERVCYDSETDAWRANARDVFGAATLRLSAIGASLPAVLMSSQEGWDRYVNDTCTLLRLADPDKERRELTEAQCKMERTGARIVELMTLAVE